MITCEAIILNVKPQFEKDLLVELLTEEVGRIRLFARFSQSNKPRFGGLLQTFNCVTVQLNPKRSGYHLMNVASNQSFYVMKQDYSKLRIAYQVIGVIRAVSQLNMVNQSLFDIVKDTFMKLNSNHVRPDILLQFYKYVLVNEGIMSNEIQGSEQVYKRMLESYAGVTFQSCI